MTLSLISFLVGALLGQRFKVIVLLPAGAVALLVAIRTGVDRAETVWSIILLATATAACLQVGYFIGMYVHHVLTAALSRRASPLTSATTSARHPAH